MNNLNNLENTESILTGINNLPIRIELMTRHFSENSQGCFILDALDGMVTLFPQFSMILSSISEGEILYIL